MFIFIIWIKKSTFWTRFDHFDGKTTFLSQNMANIVQKWTPLLHTYGCDIVRTWTVYDLKSGCHISKCTCVGK